MVRLDQLVRICRYARARHLAGVVEPLALCLHQADAETPLRAAMVVAQLAHESNEFRNLEELAPGTAYDVAVNPRLAAKLGNTEPGDGPLYKGRGWIQLTGRANYRAAGEALGLELLTHPELASHHLAAARIAAWFWRTHELNWWADLGDVEGCTKLINGGLNGIEHRITYYKRAREALGA